MAIRTYDETGNTKRVDIGGGAPQLRTALVDESSRPCPWGARHMDYNTVLR